MSFEGLRLCGTHYLCILWCVVFHVLRFGEFDVSGRHVFCGSSAGYMRFGKFRCVWQALNFGSSAWYVSESFEVCGRHYSQWD